MTKTKNSFKYLRSGIEAQSQLESFSRLLKLLIKIKLSIIPNVNEINNVPLPTAQPEEERDVKELVDCLIGVLEREELLEGILYIYLFNRNLIKVNKENKIKTKINNNKIDNKIK